MTRAATNKPKSVNEDEIDTYLARFNARNQFVSAAVNMGWQLAITILVPLFIGVQLDKRFNSAPSYTLAALFIAIGCAVVVVSQTIKQVNEAQGQTAKGKKRV